MTRSSVTLRTPATRVRRSARPQLDPLEGRLLLAAGDLDPTCGTGGLVTTAFYTTGKKPVQVNAGARAVEMQLVGGQERIVVAGETPTDSTSTVGKSIGLARYNLNGTFDTSFGTGGKVTTSFSIRTGSISSVRDMAIQPDGKIIVVGSWFWEGPRRSSDDDAFDFFVARYNSNGSLDTTFGAGGLVITDIDGRFGVPFYSEVARGVVLQPDGKIVVAGQSTNGSGDTDFAVIRYNDNGTADTSFGAGGIVTTEFLPADSAFVGDVALMTVDDGGSPSIRILVVGISAVSGAGYSALARYKPDGSLDPSFGTGGKVLTSSSPGSSVLIQPDGTILVGGTLGPAPERDFALARYDAAGNLDPSFGQGGLVTLNVAGDDIGMALARQPDGKIVMAGFVGSYNGASNDTVVARFNPDGSPDSGFGNAGVKVQAFSAGQDDAYDVTLQSDGKIVTVGGELAGTDQCTSFALARFLNDTTTAPASASVTISTSAGGPSSLSTSRSLSNTVAPGTAAFDQVLGMVALGPISGPSEPVVVLGDMGLPLARSRVRWSSQAYRFGQP